MSFMRVCPYCEKVTEQSSITIIEEYKVRNEVILSESSYYECHECHNEIEDDSVADPLVEVYRKYRDMKGYVQPQQLIEFRHKYDLTQKELSHMLGFGAVTLSRYENGALQTDAHNISLEMAMQPSSLKMLVEKNRNIFSKEKLEALNYSLERECENIYCGSSNEIVRQIGSSQIDEYSGYSSLQVSKLIELIVYMCMINGSLKTKLNKLLFYIDFYSYRIQARSITGLKYVHLPYGPVPDNFDFVYAQLIKDGALKKEEVIYSSDVVGEKYIAAREPDLSIFNKDEIAILDAVRKKFEGFTSKAITDYSHSEDAYTKTKQGQVISYAYSKHFSDLQICTKQNI